MKLKILKDLTEAVGLSSRRKIIDDDKVYVKILSKAVSPKMQISLHHSSPLIFVDYGGQTAP